MNDFTSPTDFAACTLVCGLYEEARLTFLANDHPDEPIRCAVLAGPDGPALSEFHASVFSAWTQAAEMLGLIEITQDSVNVPKRSPGKLLHFPVRTCAEEEVSRGAISSER